MKAQTKNTLPTLKPIQHSFIKAIGYDRKTGRLAIQFPKGTYTYTGVKSVTVTRLLQSPHKGHYFHTNIRGQYPFKKVA